MNFYQLRAPWILMASLLLLGMLVVLTGHVRAGGVIMSVALLAAAAARAVLPEAAVLDLKVRSRIVDIGLYLAMAVAVLLTFSIVRL